MGAQYFADILGIGTIEFFIIVVIILLLIGGKRLSAFFKNLAARLKKLQASTSGKQDSGGEEPADRPKDKQ